VEARVVIARDWAAGEPPLPSPIPFGRFHLHLLTLFPLRGTGQRVKPLRVAGVKSVA
jgi:hypothetical protein